MYLSKSEREMNQVFNFTNRPKNDWYLFLLLSVALEMLTQENYLERSAALQHLNRSHS